MNTQQVIEALKASVGSYFWESFVTGRTYAGSDESGHVSFKWFGASDFLKIRDGRIFSVHGIEFTLEEAKTLLGVYATSWERAHPEGALVQPLPFPSRNYYLKYGSIAFYIEPPYEGEEDQSFMLDYGPYSFKGDSISRFDTLKEAEKTGRQTLHDHLKAQLKP